MRSGNLDIVYEDEQLLVLNKPAELATMGLPGSTPDLLKLATGTLTQRGHDGFVAMVGRLDYPVAGLVLAAKTRAAAGALEEQRRQGRIHKYYCALVGGPGFAANAGQLTHWLRPSRRHRHVDVVSPEEPGAKQARLSYRVLQRLSQATCLEIELETGHSRPASRWWPSG